MAAPDPAQTLSRLFDFAEHLAQRNRKVAEWLSSPSGERLRRGDIDVDEAVGYLAEASTESANRPEYILGRDDVVDQFRIVSRLGRGGMGEVYLARDTLLGRPVALKLLRPVGSKAERNSFLTEARATAAIQHQNIVVLYEAGVFNERPYLALEYVAGQSLAARGRTSIKLAIRWIAQVAAALEAAHAQDLVHCDIKPANIVVGNDGRARVVDFGLARWGKIHSGGGTAAYLAPERWWGAGAEGAADIWSLGCTFYELCFGKLPFTQKALLQHLSGGELSLDSPSEPVISDAISQWLKAALDPDPKRRPSAAATRTVFSQAEIGTVASELSPFRGLERYEEEHAAIFFGREDETQKLFEHVRQFPVSLLVGLSGAGKSSIVHAGLIPLLRDLEPWRIVHVRPGEQPAESLHQALSGAIGAAFTEATNLNVLIEEFVERTDQSVLIFIDQLEELFTLDVAAERVAEFLATLLGATSIASPRVRVLCAVRDDFLPQLAALESATTLVDRSLHLRPPGRAALIRATELAVKSRGFRFEPSSLATQLADEVLKHDAGLPLLQVTCTALWARRDVETKTLSATVFHEIGGLQGSLAAHAESVLHGLSPQAFTEARRLLLSALNPDGTRRRLHAAEVDMASQSVLRRLTEGRLLIPRRDLESDRSDYELVHESLAREWPRLKDWLRTDQEKVQLEADLRQMAALWRRRGSTIDDLPTGKSFVALEYRLDTLQPALNDKTRAFVTEARRQDALHRKKQRLRLAGVLSIAATIAIAAVIASLVFRDQATQIDSAAANLGEFALELHFYDLDPKTHKSSPVSAAELPNISWRLHEPDRTNPDDPGDPLDPRFVTTTTGTSTPEYRRDIVNARGAPAFIKVDGRGRNQDCAPSIIKLRWLPGHAERTRGEIHNVKLWIPTCEASMGLMIKVPAGPYISGGPGEPPTSFESYIDPEVVIDLPEYWLDETEVSNQEFAMFAKMWQHTGIQMPNYPKSEEIFESLDRPSNPVAQITYAAATSYCRFVGKRLPSSEEWEKAARGGLQLSTGVENLHPKRNVPWATSAERQANLSGKDDGFLAAAPIFAFSYGRGPYGHLNLVGNVAEWSSSQPRENFNRGYSDILGAGWGSPVKLGHGTITYQNMRPRLDINLALGFRCGT